MRKIKELGQVSEETIHCTIDVDLYLMDLLDSSVDKKVTTDTLIELTELVLKSNIFQFSDKIYKQICGTVIGTKFAAPYAILFMTALEEKI